MICLIDAKQNDNGMWAELGAGSSCVKRRRRV